MGLVQPKVSINLQRVAARHLSTSLIHTAHWHIFQEDCLSPESPLCKKCVGDACCNGYSTRQVKYLLLYIPLSPRSSLCLPPAASSLHLCHLHSSFCAQVPAFSCWYRFNCHRFVELVVAAPKPEISTESSTVRQILFVIGVFIKTSVRSVCQGWKGTGRGYVADALVDASFSAILLQSGLYRTESTVSSRYAGIDTFGQRLRGANLLHLFRTNWAKLF